MRVCRLSEVVGQNVRFKVSKNDESVGVTVCSQATLVPREPPRNWAVGSSPL
jgi:hypothetical protein